MYIVNQWRDVCVNTDYIESFVAVQPRKDEKDGRPLVIALIGSNEEILGRYSTLADCKTVISYLSFLLNKRAELIKVPTADEVKKLNKKIVSAAFKLNDSLEVTEK